MFDMKKQLAWYKLKVGAVISMALLLVLLTVFFAGNIGDYFSQKFIIRAQIKDVRGLRVGAPVWVSGIEIGSVKDIQLVPRYGTLVTLAIKKDTASFIKNDSFATVMTQGLLGDKYVELTEGSPEAGQIAAGGVIKGAAQLEIKDLVEASSKSVSNITDFISKVDRVFSNFENNEGTVAKLLRDPSLYENLKASSAKLLALLKNIDESEGSLNMLIKDPSLYRNMLAASSSLEKFSRKINDGDGSLKMLAESRELYDNLNDASKRLNAVLQEIDSGQGAAGAILKDKAMAADLKVAVEGLRDEAVELKELTKDIKANPKKYFKFSIF